MDVTAVPKSQKVFEMKYAPSARCAGVVDGTPCPQRWTADSTSTGHHEAKRHAEQHPGHRVRVITEEHTIYLAQ